MVRTQDIAVAEQLEAQFKSERAALADPAAAQRVIDELTAVKSRVEGLKTAAARWNQTLNDGIGDLTSDIDHDMKSRIRAVTAEADEAIEAGWFGPHIDERVYARIGDVVAAAHDDVLIVASEREPKESAMVGNHGSMTPVEQLVPLLEVRS